MSEDNHNMDIEKHGKEMTGYDLSNERLQKENDYYDKDKEYEYRSMDDVHNQSLEDLRGSEIDNDWKPKIYQNEIEDSVKNRELTEANIEKINAENSGNQNNNNNGNNNNNNNNNSNVSTLDMLKDLGFVNSNNNCIVFQGNLPKPVAAQEVANLYDSGRIYVDSAGVLRFY